MRRTRRSHYALDLLHVLQFRREPSVHAEDLLVHYGGHRKTIEAVGECLPQLYVIPSLAWMMKEGRKGGKGGIMKLMFAWREIE